VPTRGVDGWWGRGVVCVRVGGRERCAQRCSSRPKFFKNEPGCGFVVKGKKARPEMSHSSAVSTPEGVVRPGPSSILRRKKLSTGRSGQQGEIVTGFEWHDLSVGLYTVASRKCGVGGENARTVFLHRGRFKQVAVPSDGADKRLKIVKNPKKNRIHDEEMKYNRRYNSGIVDV
jgi:hypothetical protein